MMPNGNPRGGFFYPTLTLMIASYIPPPHTTGLSCILLSTGAQYCCRASVKASSLFKLITMNAPHVKGEPLLHLYHYDQQDHALFHQLSNHICISSVIKYDL